MDIIDTINEEIENATSGVKRIDPNNPPQEISYINELEKLNELSKNENNMIDYSNSSIGNILENLEIINNMEAPPIPENRILILAEEQVRQGNIIIGLLRNILSETTEIKSEIYDHYHGDSGGNNSKSNS